MKEIMGGLWLAGLVAGALLGILPAAIFFILGAGAGAAAYHKEKKAASCKLQDTYPTYKY